MILCCGEALIDMLPRQTRDDEDAFMPLPGGAVFNTAIALGRLGTQTGFLSGLSSDLFGELLVKSLSTSGVSSDLAIFSDRPTTLAFVRLEKGQAQYTFYDENTAGRTLTSEDLPALPDTVKAMFFGGISLVGEPCGLAYETLMTRESRRRVTMIDPNIRASFINDEPRYRARISKMVRMANILKLSDEDLHWLCGDGDTDDLARAQLGENCHLVLITKGARGATAFSRKERVSIDASTVQMVDTVGAGDTFNAGFLAALDRLDLLSQQAVGELDAGAIHQALDLGVRAAGVTVSRAGANPPWADEV